MFTLFWDMHSGGGQKEKWSKIYIEAPIEEAVKIFYNRFGHNPERVSCTCCGGDYSIEEFETLEQASGYHRGCRLAYFKNDKEIPESEGFIFRIGKGKPKGVTSGYIEEPSDKNWNKKYQTMTEYVKNKDVLIIYEKDIRANERLGEVPDQGYVWMD